MSIEPSRGGSEIVIARTLYEAKRAKEIVPISQATGVILCGGSGTRLRDITHEQTIKPLLPLSSTKTLIDNPLSFLRQAGVKSIYLVTAEHAIDNLRKYAHTNRDRFDGIRYFVDDQPPTGTIPLLKKFINETEIQTPIIKANGDEIYASVDIQGLYETHSREQHQITGLLTDESEGAEKYKLWMNKKGKVTKIQERPFTDASGYYETGLWVIEPTQFPLIQESRSWADFLSLALQCQQLWGHPTHSKFINVNTLSDLEKARKRDQ